LQFGQERHFNLFGYKLNFGFIINNACVVCCSLISFRELVVVFEILKCPKHFRQSLNMKIQHYFVTLLIF